MSLACKIDLPLKIKAARQHQADAIKQLADGINHIDAGAEHLDAIFSLFPEMEDMALENVKEALVKLGPVLATLVTEEFVPEEESINKISKENGIDQRTIKLILLKNNIPIRSNNFYKNKS